MARRSAERRKRMFTYKARNHDDAERWDLQFWQDQGPDARLSALVDIREDVRKATMARENAS